MTAAHLDVCPYRATLRVMNISHAADLWLGELERSGRSDRTISTYRRLLDKLADDHARHVDVDDVTVNHVRRFLDLQARRANGARKAPATVAQNVSIVVGFFDWLTREGIIRRNPTRRNGDPVVSRPRQIRPEENDNVVTVSGDGVRRLIETADTMGWPERLAVNCLAYLGPRRRALAQLRVRDYDPVGRLLTFHEKGAVTIEKPVPHELARLIEAAIVAGVYTSDDDYLVPSRALQRRPGDRDDRIIWRLVRDAAAQAGVTTHVHALRAAFAVHFLETHGGELVAPAEADGAQADRDHPRVPAAARPPAADGDRARPVVTILDWEPVDALVALLALTCDERELFVDHRIVGVTPTALAAREGVSPQAIWMRLQKIEAKLTLNQRSRVAA